MMLLLMKIPAARLQVTPTKGVGPKGHEQKSDQKVESSDGSHWLFYEMLHLGPLLNLFPLPQHWQVH
jgi:hypothetical protein